MHPKLVTASEAWQSIFVLLGFSFLALVWLGTMDCRASLAMTDLPCHCEEQGDVAIHRRLPLQL